VLQALVSDSLANTTRHQISGQPWNAASVIKPRYYCWRLYIVCVQSCCNLLQQDAQTKRLQIARPFAINNTFWQQLLHYFRDCWLKNIDKSMVRLKKKGSLPTNYLHWMYLAEELFSSHLRASSSPSRSGPAMDTPIHLCNAYRGLFPQV
jgi:hypothetical protein